LADATVQLQKTKLEASQEKSRAASSISKRRQDMITALDKKGKVLQSQTEAEHEELKAAKKEKAKEAAQENRGKLLAAAHDKLDRNSASASELQDEVVRDKKRMMRALRKSNKGDDTQVAKFDKFKSALKQKEEAGKERRAAVRKDRKEILKLNEDFASKDEQSAAAMVQDKNEDVNEVRTSLKEVIKDVRKATRRGQEQLKTARQSGDKQAAAEALEALKNVKTEVKEQTKLEMRLVEKKRDVRDAEQHMRTAKRALEKAKLKTKPKLEGKTMKEMEQSVERTQAVAAEVAKESSTSERIMRSQAKVDVRKQMGEINEEKANVEALRQKLKAVRSTVQQKARQAKRTALEYTELMKAAKMEDGARLTKLADKTVKRLSALDAEEHDELMTTNNYEKSTNRLNELKANVRTATDSAYKVLKQKVKVKTQELLQKKAANHDAQLEKDEHAAYEPKKYVELARVERDRAKEELRKAESMLSDAKAKSDAEKSTLRMLPKGSKARAGIISSSKNADEKVRYWTERVSHEESNLKKGEEMLESRKHLARVAIAVYKHRSGVSSELKDLELARTSKMMKAIGRLRAVKDKQLRESIDEDAKKISSMALKPRGAAEVNAIMRKAMKAGQAGADLSSTIGYIGKKLDENGWGPEIGESDGLSHQEYEDRHMAIQQIPVENGMYGTHARTKLHHLLKQIDAGEDPGTPRHGISRNQLRADERANKKTILAARMKQASQGPLPHDVNDLDNIVNVLHEKDGMSREQLHAAEEAITGRRIELSTPDADRWDREKAADRLDKIQESWKRYEKKMNDVVKPETTEEDADLSWQIMQTKQSFEKGRKFFDDKWGSPEMEDVPIQP